jgi:aspartyl-tRNA(Asn)/glutamyl-tRNA(Gln) amidotransferase subunit A
MYLQDIFTVQANLAGVPAISLPTGTHSNGLPYGLQLMAKPFADEWLMEACDGLFPA